MHKGAYITFPPHIVRISIIDSCIATEAGHPVYRANPRFDRVGESREFDDEKEVFLSREREEKEVAHSRQSE